MTQSHLSYKPFNFLKLDTRLNLQKLQKKKKQQLQKQTLNINQKLLPNLQLIKQCDNILKLYKDHYNGNRKFSIFSKKEFKQENLPNQLNQEQLKSTQVKDNSKFTFQRSNSTHNVKGHQNKKRSSLLEQGNNIMKPLKVNHYISNQGIIKLFSDHKNPSQNNNNSQISTAFKFSKKQSNPQNFRVKSLASSVSLLKRQASQISQGNSPMIMKNPQIVAKQKRKYLKQLFRDNIFLIIQKLKLMKISYSQVILKKVFDTQIPYRFGYTIFHDVKQGNQAKVFRSLTQNRVSIFSKDTTLKTTIMWACIRGYHKIAEMLLINGVQPHMKDRNGKTALYYAIKYNHPECVKIMFLYSYYLEDDIQSWKMSEQNRRMIRVGITSIKFLLQLKNIDKKKQYFDQQYKYYFKQ